MNQNSDNKCKSTVALCPLVIPYLPYSHPPTVTSLPVLFMNLHFQHLWTMTECASPLALVSFSTQFDFLINVLRLCFHVLLTILLLFLWCPCQLSTKLPFFFWRTQWHERPYALKANSQAQTCTVPRQHACCWFCCSSQLATLPPWLLFAFNFLDVVGDSFEPLPLWIGPFHSIYNHTL